jgi:hypothetical protein
MVEPVESFAEERDKDTVESVPLVPPHPPHCPLVQVWVPLKQFTMPPLRPVSTWHATVFPSSEHGPVRTPEPDSVGELPQALSDTGGRP